MDDGLCSIVEKRSDRVYKLRVTKRGQRLGEAASIDRINEAIAKGLADADAGLVVPKAKRIYRRAEDLADPSAAPNAEVNLPTVKLTPRVSRTHAELFERLAAAHPSKRKALERAIELLAASETDA